MFHKLHNYNYVKLLKSNSIIILISVFSLTYITIIFPLSLSKYYTFHDTFFDLGLNNEILWLLIHGGISNYYASHFSYVYPIQWSKPIIFLLAIIYYLYPHPELLLFIQTLFLGLLPFPLQQLQTIHCPKRTAKRGHPD